MNMLITIIQRYRIFFNSSKLEFIKIILNAFVHYDEFSSVLLEFFDSKCQLCNNFSVVIC